MVPLAYKLLGLVVAFILVELAYFRIARRYNILDKPNHRSSHSLVTIRGGGIIFPLAFFIGEVFFGYAGWEVNAGVLALAVISFADDIVTLKSSIRMAVHFVAACLLVVALSLIHTGWLWALGAIVIIIGSINAFNFMDGINGILGVYSGICLGTLWYIHNYVTPFAGNGLLLLACLLSVCVFCFFNLRTRAVCFSGDVGSVSIAYIILYFTGLLIITTGQPLYLCLLLVFGVETAVTMALRKIRGEKLTEAHRSHFYQYLANDRKLPHTNISLVYGAVQVVINAFVITFIQSRHYFLLMLVVVLAAGVYIMLRMRMEGRERLMVKY